MYPFNTITTFAILSIAACKVAGGDVDHKSVERFAAVYGSAVLAVLNAAFA
jgi:hypothetical protein